MTDPVEQSQAENNKQNISILDITNIDKKIKLKQMIKTW